MNGHSPAQCATHPLSIACVTEVVLPTGRTIHTTTPDAFAERDLNLLRRERQDLNERLRAVNYDPTLGTIEKSAERRAIRARLDEIATEEGALG